MHIAVAIVGFRNPEDILQCLASLGASSHTDFDVVICENGGPDAFDALQAALPKTLGGGQTVRVVLAPRNLGYGGGVNVCLRETPNADAWWVLNPDTQPYPGAMAAMAARLQVGDCDAVGCTLHLPDGRIQSFGGRWQPWLARAVSIGHGGSVNVKPDPASIEHRQNYLNGASMLVGRRFLEVAGPMREEYFLYCEEVEWCLRALARGLRLGFAPDALVLHQQGTTTGRLPDIRRHSRMSVFLNARNQILVTRDCFRHRLPAVALSALGSLILRYGRRLAWRQLVFAVSGWGAGVMNHRDEPDWLRP